MQQLELCCCGGVTLSDTADAYGANEGLLGEALAPFRDQKLIDR